VLALKQLSLAIKLAKKYSLVIYRAEVGRSLFFGLLVCWSAAQWTTDMIADQQDSKISGPTLADYQN
jgi:hypothetical protein